MAAFATDLRNYATAEEKKYLNKKTVGGDSSRLGLIFEERVAAFKIIEHVSRVKARRLEATDVKLVLQARSFVDDIAFIVNDSVLWIEAKSGDVGWGSLAQEVEVGSTATLRRTKRTVAQNFESQMRVDNSAGRSARYALAIPSHERGVDLASKRLPLGLGAVRIFVLPNGNNISEIEELHPGFRKCLRQICPLSESDRDLENVLWAIMTSLRKLDAGQLTDLGSLAVDADVHFKGLLSMGRNQRLRKDVERILYAIGQSEDFRFAVCGSVLHYVYEGDRGTGKFTIGSESGDSFEQDVLDMSSASFDSLVPLLRKRRR